MDWGETIKKSTGKTAGVRHRCSNPELPEWEDVPTTFVDFNLWAQSLARTYRHHQVGQHSCLFGLNTCWVGHVPGGGEQMAWQCIGTIKDRIHHRLIQLQLSTCWLRATAAFVKTSQSLSQSRNPPLCIRNVHYHRPLSWARWIQSHHLCRWWISLGYWIPLYMNAHISNFKVCSIKLESSKFRQNFNSSPGTKIQIVNSDLLQNKVQKMELKTQDRRMRICLIPFL